MVKASSQIEKELGLLQQRTEDMAIALEPIYDGYLNALAEASKQQLMSAAYHLCTQAYPDKFLTLSWKERNELQKALQILAAQIQSQLQQQRARAKKMSRRPQRNSGLEFLHRLLESRSSSAIVHAPGDSSDDLLEKLSEVAQLDQRSDSLDRSLDRLDRRKRDHSSNVSDIDESEIMEDWEDIPTAEGDDESDSTPSESLFMQSSQPDADAFTAVDLEDMDFSDSVNSESEESLDDEELDFEMEVPAAEQRLTISDEEDLLTALKGLARHSTVEDSTGDDEQPLAPVHLFRQQMLMEKGIRDVFKTISNEVNELLQKAKVMPSFPKALMAAATDSQGIGEPVNAVPNVVMVSVRVMHGEVGVKSDEVREGERELPGPKSDKRRRRSPSNQARSTSSRSTPSRSKSSRASSPRHLAPHDMVEIDTLPELAVINLQLSEVAFTDPTVSAWRTRLRKELSTLKRLGTRYTKTQRSLETSKAEDAWRSSWTAQDRD
ncbi:hypothetical protein S7335_5337 [Synechococcus sp. PCC 7335]|uniref:hypothetical protein n=1 Tax=Synechococcus sp. (strain ATCC 29403 / PCC 7335) TaxID=91464 RepID=UPI00017EB102|nr:hypothetical protein [Synechococcus sp. PCC 7335]EDX87627.1 hypothetical protein S7335_5337 [Synechococcus sp. PCC 7335]